MLSRDKLGLNNIEPSTKFTQCQYIIRNALKTSTKSDTKAIPALTYIGSNMQYYRLGNTKEVVKVMREEKERHIRTLTYQGFVINAIWKNSIKAVRRLCPSIQAHLPMNIYNFTVRYLNNTLPTKRDIHMWKLAETSNCRCGELESLKHVVAGCSTSLNERRYNYRHYSILVQIAKFFSGLPNTKIYCDILGYVNPEEITAEVTNQRPDTIIQKGRSLWIIELTAGFETNLEANTERKTQRYAQLIANLSQQYDSVKYIDISVSALGFFGKSC